MVYPVSESYSDAWNRPDFQYPGWWRAQPTLPDRMGASAVTAGVSDGTRRASRDDERDADPSPHFDGRAQPGDVIGVETGGEQTHIGDTKEDENERRRS